MNALISRLAKLQIQGNGGTYLRTQIVMFPDGKEREIMIYSGEKALYLGQCTIVRTITIHESVIKDQLLFDYVLAHEFAHLKQWWVILSVPFAALFLFGLFLFLSSLILIISSIIDLNLNGIFSALFGLSTASLMIILSCAFSWALEIQADLFAINRIGIQGFVNIKNSPRVLKHGLGSKIVIFMTHPPTFITQKLWYWFHRNASKNGD